MKIAVWHDLPSGGGKRQLYDHVQALVSRGNYVRAWCPSTADTSYLPLTKLIPERVLPLKPRVRSRSPLDASRLISSFDGHTQAVVDDAAEWSPDVWYVSSSSRLRIPPIGRFAPAPAVLYLGEPSRWIHEADTRSPWAAVTRDDAASARAYMRARSADILKTRYARLYLAYEQMNLEAFAVVLVNSYFSRESVLRAYGREANVCYLGIAPGPPAVTSWLERNREVLGVGAFVREKRIDFVLRAAARMAKPAPIRWIGNVADWGYVDELRRIADAEGVEFMPSVGVSSSELAAAYSSARVFAYSPRLEPFGYAPLEANSYGLPVVAVPEGGVRETVLDGVNGILATSSSSFAAGLEMFCDDEQAWTTYAAAATRYIIEQWDEDSAADRITNLLEQARSAG